MITKGFMCFLLLMAAYILAYPQKSGVQEVKTWENGTPRFIVFDTEKRQYQKGNEGKIWTEHLGITASDNLELIKTRFDKEGMEHLKYQQYYKGIKVEGGTYVLHFKDGAVSGNKSAEISSSPYFIVSDNNNDGYKILISPNPAKNEVAIKLTGGLFNEDTSFGWDMEIYNSAQMLIKKIPEIKIPEIKINIQNWAEGIYLVKATIGGTLLSDKLIVSK